jgi:hypothetical protein
LSSSKKFDMERDFAEGVNLSEARTPIPHLTHCVYVYTVYLFTQRRGEGEELNKGEGERRNRRECRTQSWMKIPKYLNVRNKLAISSL